MKRTLTGMALFAQLLCGVTHAADWIALGKAGAVDQYYYDRSKLTIKDEEITFWKKVVFATPQAIHGKEVTSGLLRERIHCADHTAKLISYLYYSASGDTVQYIAKDESDAAPIIPDTVGDAFEQKLCPLVWRKQDEARIKAEQKAAEGELTGTRRTAPQEKPAAGTSAGTNSGRGSSSITQVPSPATAQPPASGPANPANPANTVPVPGRTPPDQNQAPVTVPPNSATVPGKTPPDPNAAPIPRQQLPMPQIMEQLY